jgi:hypothetical protein
MAYSLLEVFDEMVKAEIAPYFKSKGFKKQNLNFYKVENGLTFLVNFQKSTYNSVDYAAFFINCGIYCDVFEQAVGETPIANPKEYDCVFRERFERITGFSAQQFELLESSEAGKKQLAATILTEMDKVLAFFEPITSVADLVTLCIERGSYFYEKVFKYLCIRKNMTQLEAYFQDFGNNFKDDERYLFFQSRLNDILRENGIAPMTFKAKMSVPLALQRPPNE